MSKNVFHIKTKCLKKLVYIINLETFYFRKNMYAAVLIWITYKKQFKNGFLTYVSGYFYEIKVYGNT